MQKKVPQLMKKMIKKNNGTFKKCFAQRLRELRKENGITQAGLAERMNVSRTCIANWESSERIPEVAAKRILPSFLKFPLTTFAAERTNGTE